MGCSWVFTHLENVPYLSDTSWSSIKKNQVCRSTGEGGSHRFRVVFQYKDDVRLRRDLVQIYSYKVYGYV